ncbi:MAG: alanine racemase [Urechidicola sp.]|jgi:alanine racemase
MNNNHVTTLQIDLNAVKFNLNYFKSLLTKDTEILVVVKAFGYGSDAVEIAKCIQDDVSYFAVAYTDEGIALREAGIKTPILVFHPQEKNLELIIKYCLEPSLYSKRILSHFLSITNNLDHSEYPVHLKFNTGLNRLGFQESDLDFITSSLLDNKSVKVKSIFSHLAASEDKHEREFSRSQILSFEKIVNKFEANFGFKPMKHMTNTSGIINYPEAHYDMVRVGIGLYGFGNDEQETSKLENVLSLTSVISQVHTIEKGESIGYNRGFFTKKNTLTATIPIGHADGISRRLSNGKGWVTINHKKAPIIGNVCMDMIMVDVTNIKCQEGDNVVIFNNQQTVEQLAKNSDTISYELLTAVSQRIKRYFIQ